MNLKLDISDYVRYIMEGEIVEKSLLKGRPREKYSRQIAKQMTNYLWQLKELACGWQEDSTYCDIPIRISNTSITGREVSWYNRQNYKLETQWFSERSSLIL